MFCHVVLIKLKEDCPADAVKILLNELRALPDQIDEITRYEINSDELHSENSADVCVISEFANEAALDRYRVHPAHVRVLNDSIRPYLDWIRAADYTL